jgi:hypothetical protein
MIKVEEVRSIKVSCNYTPDQWDPNNQAVGADTTRWHKAKLLNQRVEKYAPTSDAVQLYMNLSRFATEQGFGDIGVVIKVVEYIYRTKLIFEDQEQAA